MLRKVFDPFVASILFAIGRCDLALKHFRSRHWPICDARVMSTEYENGSIGWHLVTVYFEYHIDGARWGSWQTRPFVAESSAQDYANALVENTRLQARVKPNDPTVAVIVKDPLH